MEVMSNEHRKRCADQYRVSWKYTIQEREHLMKEYATDEEVNNALSEIVQNGHSIMAYSRDEQISIAMEVVQRTGKSVRINAMTIHPSKPISSGERIFRSIVTLVVFAFAMVIIIGIFIALISMVGG